MAATFPITSSEGAMIDLLSLGYHVELIDPPALRRELARRVQRMAQLYGAQPPT
jgi:hypothetical protein